MSPDTVEIAFQPTGTDAPAGFRHGGPHEEHPHGWTMYPPLSVQMGMGMDLAIFAVHLMGCSSIMGAINIITTILNLRAPDMALMRMPMFCWTWLFTANLLLAVMPVLAAAVTMVLTDRHFGTYFFKAAGGGPAAAAWPWEGAPGLEWTVPSPAPHHTCARAPALR